MIRSIIKNKWAYILLMPWLILFSVFVLYPFFLGIGISFTEYDFANIKYVFVENYKDIFKEQLFAKALLTSFKLALCIVPFIIVLSLWISNSIISMKKRSQAFIKASLYIPGTVSSVALVITWKWIFNPAYGLSNYLCTLIGIEPINWYGQSEYALLLIIVLVVLLSLGPNVILFSAAMIGIPISYYEAADIDGATGLSKFRYITLPLLKPTTLYVTITATIGAFQVFELPLLLTAGGPNFSTTSVMLLLYKTAFEYEKFGMAAAIGVIIFVIIAIISTVQFKFLSTDVQY